MDALRYWRDVHKRELRHASSGVPQSDFRFQAGEAAAFIRLDQTKYVTDCVSFLLPSNHSL